MSNASSVGLPRSVVTMPPVPKPVSSLPSASWRVSAKSMPPLNGPPAGGDDAAVGLDEHGLGLPGADRRRHAAVAAERRIEPRRRRGRRAVDGDVAHVGAWSVPGPWLTVQTWSGLLRLGLDVTS